MSRLQSCPPNRVDGTAELAELSAVWSAAEKVDASLSEEIKARREAKRVAYRREKVEFVDGGFGQAQRRLFAIGRDLSRGGVGLFCRSFIYQNRPCVVSLQRHLGGDEEVAGRIVHCSHLTGSWHQIGIKFDKPIYPGLFLRPDQVGELMDNDLLEAGGFSGDVLLIDTNELQRRLVAFHVESLGGKVVHAPNMQGVLEAIQSRPAGIDATIVNLTGVPVAERKTLLERIGRVTDSTMIAFDTETDAPPEGGAAIPLLWPITRGSVAAALAQVSGDSGPAGKVIRSSFAGSRSTSKEMDEMLESAVQQVRALGRDLRNAIEAADAEACLKCAGRLRFLGTSFGYEPVGTVAGDTIKALNATLDCEMAAALLNELHGMTQRVAA